jgi:hypothetical protein
VVALKVTARWCQWPATQVGEQSFQRSVPRAVAVAAPQFVHVIAAT